LLQEVMTDVRSWEQAMRDLYGPLLTVDKNPLFVWTDGSCFDVRKPSARAGAGVFWGEDCPRNIWRRLHGAQQTNNRAELFAILLALDNCDPRRALTLYSDSEYAIRSIAEWAPARADVGWTCKNGDLLQQISAVVLRRTAGLHLVWVKSHNKNAHNDAADGLAKLGA
ncbi:ribonuclease H-like protein, partial [Exidia glandulosa HHB12029]